jgi:hypothetical protein
MRYRFENPDTGLCRPTAKSFRLSLCISAGINIYWQDVTKFVNPFQTQKIQRLPDRSSVSLSSCANEIFPLIGKRFSVFAYGMVCARRRGSQSELAERIYGPVLTRRSLSAN